MAPLSSRETILSALQSLSSTLERRRAGDFDTVLVPDPALPELADLTRHINGLMAELKSHQKAEDLAQSMRAEQLAQAYNALQSRNDEMTRDLETARRIQLRLVPQGDQLPERPEIDTFGYYASMENVGGDLYDIMRIGRNAYGILMADVSGHGLPSALITALVKVAFRTKVRWGVSVVEVAEDVNQELYPILSDLDYYVTAFFGILNLEDGSFRYTNCGHHPGLLLQAGTASPREMDSRGRFLGAFDELAATEGSTVLAPGDSFFLFTDGIIESRNFLDEEFGQQRLLACLEEAHARREDLAGPGRSRRLVETVRKDLTNFTMGAPARDDISMFAFQVLARSSPPGPPPV